MRFPTPEIDLSVVIPLFNEEESIQELTNLIIGIAIENGYTHEIVFVDDGSTDRSWELICKAGKRHNNIKGIRFNKNYGKSAALNTGFQAAKGEVVITMDADLQDNPEEIPALYQMIRKDGYDMVSGWKAKRKDPLSKTIPTKFFNSVTRKMSGIHLHDFNCGLKAYNYKVIKSIEVYGEMHRYIPLLAKWNGFTKIGEKKVMHQARKYGKTKFGLERFIFGFLDLLSITFVTKFKKRPMHFFGSLGTMSFFVGALIAVFLIVEKLVIIHVYHEQLKRDIVDQPLFYCALVAIVVGVQLFVAGYIGEMINVSSPKRKKEYLIADITGIDDDTRDMIA